MVAMEVISTLQSASRTLYEVAQEARENHEECGAIRETVTSLTKTVKASINSNAYASKNMETKLADLTK